MAAQRDRVNLARELRVLADRLEVAYTAKEVAVIQDALIDRMVDLGMLAADLAAESGGFKV